MSFYKEIYLFGFFFFQISQGSRETNAKKDPKPNPKTQCINIVKASYYKKWLYSCGAVIHYSSV